MRILPAIIIAIAIVLAPILWFVLPMLFSSNEDFGGPAIDSGARIEIEMLNQQVDDLRQRMDAVVEQMREVANRQVYIPDGGQDLNLSEEELNAPLPQSGPNDIIDAYAQVVLIANRNNVNDGLVVAGPSFLTQTFGLPRENLGDTCEPMTNPRLASKLVTADVGPIRVTMLQPAIDSLRAVFENVRRTDPDLYARISTAGSLCVRLIRGSTSSASTHSFGLSVDLNIDGKLDTLGDGRTQLGLTILADFFKAEGWVWGAAWRREDSMHFEVSRQQLEKWIAEGKL